MGNHIDGGTTEKGYQQGLREALRKVFVTLDRVTIAKVTYPVDGEVPRRRDGVFRALVEGERTD